MRDFDAIKKRTDQRRGGIAVFIVLLTITSALIVVGMMAGVMDKIGGKFTP